MPIPALLPVLGTLQPFPHPEPALAGLLAFGCFFWAILFLAALAFPVFCFWRIFAKAGFNGALSLLWLIPAVGPIIVLCILAFAAWPNEQGRPH